MKEAALLAAKLIVSRARARCHENPLDGFLSIGRELRFPRLLRIAPLRAAVRNQLPDDERDGMKAPGKL